MSEAILLCARTAIECAGLVNRGAHHTPGGALCPLLVAHDPVRDVPTGSTGYVVLIDRSNLKE